MVKKEEKKKLPTIDIKGKPYVIAKEKLLHFHEVYPNGALVSDIVEQSPNTITILTKCIPDVDKPERYFTGIASETKGSSFINDSSHVENCETSSRARALSGCGIGIEETSASAEEVANAIIQQDEKKVIHKIRDIMKDYYNLIASSREWLADAIRLGVMTEKNIDRNMFYILNSVTINEALERYSAVNLKFTKRFDETKEALRKEKKSIEVFSEERKALNKKSKGHNTAEKK